MSVAGGKSQSLVVAKSQLHVQMNKQSPGNCSSEWERNEQLTDQQRGGGQA